MPDWLRRHLTIVIAIVGTVWAALFMIGSDYQQRPPFNEERDIAYHIASGHGFRSPFDTSPNAAPSAWSAPVYPLVIAAAFRLFGISTPESVTALMLVHAICFGLLLAGMYSIAGTLFKSETAGFVCAGIIAVHPLYLFFVRDFWDGMISLTMFVMLILGAVRAGISAGETGHTSIQWDVVLGGGMGILALTNATYIPTYPVLVFLAHPGKPNMKLWTAALRTFAAFCIVLAPWTIRNYREFGKFVFIRSTYGFSLFAGNQPHTFGWLYDPSSVGRQPVANPMERALVLHAGETRYDEICMQRFKKLYAANPVKFWVSCPVRVGYVVVGNPTYAEYPFLFWIHWNRIHWDQLLLNCLFAGLGFVGMARFWNRSYQLKLVAVLAFVTIIPFVPTGVIDRYTLATRAILILFASAYLVEIAAAIKRRLSI